MNQKKTMKRIIRLTESDLTRIVKRVIMEQNVSEKRKVFFDNLAKKISTKLIGKKLYFGQYRRKWKTNII